MTFVEFLSYVWYCLFTLLRAKGLIFLFPFSMNSKKWSQAIFQSTEKNISHLIYFNNLSSNPTISTQADKSWEPIKRLSTNQK